MPNHPDHPRPVHTVRVVSLDRVAGSPFAYRVAAMMNIAPDYLAFTRQTVEGAPHD